jgi:hypothetical protein
VSWFSRSDGYFVYWLRDDYETLYVGYTENPSRRIKEHSKQKPWFPEVTNISIRRYATKEEALKTEAFEILFGEDLYNLDLNQRLADAAFDDAQDGRHYPILERYEDVPLRRFS